MDNSQSIRILGINFFNGKVQDLVNQLKRGGLLVVPAAPALKDIKTDRNYYDALLRADIAIADSGYMALLWNLTHKKKINRISGLEFLITFLSDKDIIEGSDILLVNPRKIDAESNLNYLQKIDFRITSEASYIAPIYSKENVVDEDLLKLIEEKKPRYIIVNIGGGTQEKLGAYLRNNLSYLPGIICTGAALAFLTGQQARIPKWADKLYLGWLFRCFEKPKTYIPRYLGAFKLLTVMIGYKFGGGKIE